MSAIANLKKAFQAQSISKDDFSLEKYFAKFEEKGAARFTLKGIESKYIAKFDKPETGQLGFRTRFITEQGSIGTFSNAAHRMFEFYAQIMGHHGDEHFLHIDIDGQVVIEVTTIALDQTRSTYNFEIVEEGSDLKGFTDFLPNAQNILSLPTGQKVDLESGEVTNENEPF
jgi:hypothetical protein